MKTPLIFLCVAIFGGLTTHADALDFTFSFDLTNGMNSQEVADSGFTGTISGEILGLQNNDAAAVPTEVIIDSAPLAFGLTLPYVFTQSEVLDGTTFDVTNGVLTENGSFYLSTPYSPIPHTTTALYFDLSGSNILETPLGEGGGLATDVTFTPISAPEPALWMLTLAGVMCFALYRIRSKALEVKR